MRSTPGAEGFGLCSGLSEQGRQMLLPVPTSPSEQDCFSFRGDVFKIKSAF